MKLVIAVAMASSGTTAPASEQPPRPRVAIIDSGIAKTAELAPLIVAEYDMGSTPARAPFQPRYDHGTMVATILARASARQVDIVSVRIDDVAGCPAEASPPCQPSAELVAGAIRHAADLGVDAINISLALGNGPAITAAVRYAGSKGISVILAAGNQGLDRPANLAMARAAYPNAVLVGAIDGAGSPWSGTNRPDRSPVGYNYVWHFGVNVPTTAADGRAVSGTGTSFAAPIETARLLTARSAVR